MSSAANWPVSTSADATEEGVIGSTGGGSASAAEMPCKEGLAADDAGEAGKGEPGLMVVLFESEPSKK